MYIRIHKNCCHRGLQVRMELKWSSIIASRSCKFRDIIAILPHRDTAGTRRVPEMLRIRDSAWFHALRTQVGFAHARPIMVSIPLVTWLTIIIGANLSEPHLGPHSRCALMLSYDSQTCLRVRGQGRPVPASTPSSDFAHPLCFPVY